MQPTNRNKTFTKSEFNIINQINPKTEFNNLDDFYNKRQETSLVTDIIKSANLVKTKQNNILTDLETKLYNLEETEKTLANYENEFAGIQNKYASDQKALNAFNSLTGTIEGFSNKIANKLSDKLIYEEDEKKNAILEQSVNLAVSNVTPSNPESIFQAMHLTDKYLLAMFGSKNSEQIKEMRRIKNGKILSDGIDKLIEIGDFDNAYDLYVSMSEDSFDKGTSENLRESIILGKEKQIHNNLFIKYVEEKSPEDIKDWLSKQKFNIEIGKGANKLWYKPNEEDINKAYRFISDSEVKKKITQKKELEANKAVFNEEFMKLVFEGKGTRFQGLNLANKMAKSSEELEAFEGKVNKFTKAMHSKENQSYKNIMPLKIIQDLTKRLILGKADVEDIDATKLCSGEEAKNLLDTLKEEANNKGNLDSESIFSFDWTGMKSNLAKVFKNKFNRKGTTSFDEELFDNTYESAVGEIIDKAVNTKMSEKQILEMLTAKLGAIDVDALRIVIKQSEREVNDTDETSVNLENEEDSC